MRDDCVNDMKVSLVQKKQFQTKREEIVAKIERIEDKIKGLNESGDAEE